MSRGLPKPYRLAGVDLDAHRERAVRALTLFFGADLSVSPAEWEARARAALATLEGYGLVPVHLYDPALGEPARKSMQALLDAIRRGAPLLTIDIERAGLPVEMFNVDEAGGPGA